jgi:hypothetical protein
MDASRGGVVGGARTQTIAELEEICIDAVCISCPKRSDAGKPVSTPPDRDR